MTMRTLRSLLIVALLVTGPSDARAGGRGGSSGGRSSSSGGSRGYSSGGGRGSSYSGGGSRPSSPRPTSGPSSSGGRGYTSSGGAPSSRAAATPPSKGAQARPTYTNAAGQSHPIQANAPHVAAIRSQVSQTQWNTRQQRQRQAYAAYAYRPMVYYADPYHPFFWWWLLERDRTQRAQWAYHHRQTMAPARYSALAARDPQLDAQLREWEARGVPRNPQFIPRDEGVLRYRTRLGGVLAAAPWGAVHVLPWLYLPPESSDFDFDLMYTDEFVDAVYNPQTADAFSETPISYTSAAPSEESWGGLCCMLPFVCTLGGGLWIWISRQRSSDAGP